MRIRKSLSDPEQSTRGRDHRNRAEKFFGLLAVSSVYAERPY